MENLDHIDRKILELLQQDCRITIKELAKKLHLSNTPIYERVKKLERSGIIQNYVALLNPEKIDRNMIVFISIYLPSILVMWWISFGNKLWLYPK